MASKPLSEWHRLHPASVGVNLIPQTWRFLRSMWPIILAAVAGRSTGGTRLDVPLLIFALLATVGRTCMHFLTLRYRVTPEGLEIKNGWLNRQTRVLPPDRIQNVELVRNPFHRLSGLVEVRIETAAGEEVEGELSALSLAAGEHLVRTLKERQGEQANTNPAQSPTGLSHLSTWDLFKFAATSTRFGALLLFAGVAFEALSGIDAEWVHTMGDRLSGSGVWILALTAITGSWLVGLGVTMNRHYGFTMERSGTRLIAQEGLLTTRRVELQQSRIQLLVHHEPLLRRLAGFGSVWIDTAAMRRGAVAAARAEAFIPVVEHRKVDKLVASTLTEMDLEDAISKLASPHPKALTRARLGSLWKTLFVTLFIVWAFGAWGWLAPCVILPLEWLTTALDHAHQGWLVTESHIVTRSGYLNRRTHIIPRYRLQSTEVIQGPFLRRWELGRLVVRIAGKGVPLPLVTLAQAQALQDQLIHATPTSAKEAS